MLALLCGVALLLVGIGIGSTFFAHSGPPERLRVVLLGDSVVGGCYQDPPWYTHFPPGVVCVNFAMPGVMCRQVRARQLPLCAGHRYDVAVVMVGTNDAFWQTRLAAYSLDLRAVLSTVRADRLVVVTAPARPRVSRLLDPYAAAGRRLATQRGATYIDLRPVVPPDARYFLPDGYHPNGMGARLIYQALAPAILDARRPARR